MFLALTVQADVVRGFLLNDDGSFARHHDTEPGNRMLHLNIWNLRERES